MTSKTWLFQKNHIEYPMKKILFTMITATLCISLNAWCFSKRYFGPREAPDRMVAFWRENSVAVVSVNGESGYPHWRYIKVPFYAPAGETEIVAAYYVGTHGSGEIRTRLTTRPGETWLICSVVSGDNRWSPKFTQKIEDCPKFELPIAAQRSVYGGPEKFDPAYRPDD